MNAIEEHPRAHVPVAAQGLLFTDDLPEFDEETGYRGPMCRAAKEPAGFRELRDGSERSTITATLPAGPGHPAASVQV